MDRFLDTKEFSRVIKRVSEALKPYQWCLIGGRAVEVHANPPQTPDIDILVKYANGDTARVVRAMGECDFKLDRSFSDKGFAPMLFFKDLIEKDTAGHVEVDLIGAFEDVHAYAIERAEKKKFGKSMIPVAKAEDVIILKATAALSPRRDHKMARDVEAMKAINENVELDTDYIETVLTVALGDYSDEVKLLQRIGVLKK